MITLTLTEQELQALSGLLDAGVRSTGLASIKAAYGLLAKLEEAVAAANVAPKTNGHDHTSDTGVAA